MRQACTLSPVTGVHRDFLFSLFTQTFGMPLLNSGLPEELALQLVRQQFDAKEAAYRNEFPDALHSIIERDTEAVGQIRISHEDKEIHLVDISILPACQGQGIAASVIRDLLKSAGSQGVPVSLSVERHSPAFSIYKKLNFQIVWENETHIRMIGNC